MRRRYQSAADRLLERTDPAVAAALLAQGGHGALVRREFRLWWVLAGDSLSCGQHRLAARGSGIAVEFRLLGEIEARDGGQPVDVGHARQRCVLAMLLAEANHVVPIGQLADRVWGQRLPADPVGALQTYVSLLRRALAPAADVTITWKAPGYKAALNAESIDLHRFRDLIARAHAASGDDDAVAALLEQALDLWCGEPFAGLDTPWISDARAALTLQRHGARLDLIDIGLRRGQHDALLAFLALLADDHPLDERVAGQLMLACYRSGRQADALEHYEKLRRQLADELGADPSPPLQRLYQQILTAAPALGSPATSVAPIPARPAVVPRWLPAPPRLFAGRASELARLTASLGGGGEQGGTVMISAIGGAGGIGKTWLALHWAHQHLDRFPDGQLWVDLHGFDPSGRPLPADAALRGFLSALGVDPAVIPPDLEAAAGLYRSLVAGKRMLVVLDNAREASQVIPLLPGTAGCMVLVTSRSQLAGLVTRYGAQPLDLDVLPGNQARDLLARQLGAARVAAEPGAVTDLLACCAGLPLALSVAAARAAAHPGFPLAVLAAELRDAATRLDALETGDLATGVRAALSWSYRALDPQPAMVFGLLGLAPGPDIGLPAAASFTALDLPTTRAILRELETASLVQHHAPGRYRMHDLVRLYAAEVASHDQAGTELIPALQRVTDFYLHTAHAGDRLLAPHRPSIELSPPAAGCIPYQPADAAASLEWFDTEHQCLLAAQRLAAAHDWHAPAWQFAWALNTFHTFRGYLSEQVTAWQAGLAGAEHLDQPATRALARRWLGESCARAGRHAEALDHLRRVIAQAEQAGDISNRALGHNTLARVLEHQGNYHQALDQATRALNLFRTLGRPAWEARALNAVGWYHAILGNFAQARTSCEAALTLCQRHGNRGGEAGTLDSLGFIALRTGDPARALEYFRLALTLLRDLGHTYHEADVLAHLAEAHAAHGEQHNARHAWRQALELYQAQHRTTDATRIQEQLRILDHDPWSS